MRANSLLKRQQLDLIRPAHCFPSTRYQGSKVKLLDWIRSVISELDFHTALDAFGGTGAVAYMLKDRNKKVTYNDYLLSNWYIGTALIENNDCKLSLSDIDDLLTYQPGIQYKSFIAETFKDIYFLDEENEWLDIVIKNISALSDNYKRAIAYFALFQSCMVKRPYNLFHRKNLYIRTSNVKRSFGNKTTWDKPFEQHFRKYASEANAAVFANDYENRAINQDIFDISNNYDLIYIDTPYISGKGVGVDYLSFYHFMEGIVNYDKWPSLIDYNSKHLRMRTNGSVWADKKLIADAFDKMFCKFSDSILVVSYRSDGIPTPDELRATMLKYKKNVEIHIQDGYKYVLSHNNKTREVLLIGT